jgi:hypothetical protein
VLVANSVNPREIRQPILVQDLKERFRKVVGIVYRGGWTIPLAAEDEAVPLIETQLLESAIAQSEGLVRVVGESAEPIALNGQYLISAPPIRNLRDLELHNGRPIVITMNGRTLFKRLRLTKGQGPIVLESLDAAGRYVPVVISAEEAHRLGDLLVFRPVLGVLFDSQSAR